VDLDAVLATLFDLIAPHLNERQRRLLLGAGARALGRGGGARMARLSGMSRPTVYAGVRELDEPPDPHGRIRRPGGGPKRLRDTDPDLVEALDRLVDPDTRGDPCSPLRWTTKSTRELAEALTTPGPPGQRRHRRAAAQGAGLPMAAHHKDPWRAPSTKTGTPSSATSSATSTSGPASTWPPPSQR
jgi:hypothetical protein